MKVILGVVLLILLAIPAALFFMSADTALKFDPAPSVVGLQTPVKLIAANPHGVRNLRVFVEQGGKRFPAYSKSSPATRVMFWRSSLQPQTIDFTTGASSIPDLQPGKAKLIVEADSNDFRARRATIVQDVQVVKEPPRVVADGFQHYINQGGAELVTFTVSGYWSEAGVRLGKYTFRSFPMPGQSDQNRRFSLFAFPWDVPAETVPVVYVRNPAGQEVTARFWNKIFPKKFRSRDLELTDGFIEKVLGELDPGGSGDVLPRFLKINGDMRKQNNEKLASLRFQTEERFLWSQPFKQLTNSKVESFFADRRSYHYKGAKVDEQVHLGFDLSVTSQVPVVASNAGKVVFADHLGIYGNCVVIDHGYGLQSIYAHLSGIDVKANQMVDRDQKIGNSGATGLAGGDHLHYSMQVDGVQVNPVEWWDDHWIQDRVRSKVPLAESAGK